MDLRDTAGLRSLQMMQPCVATGLAHANANLISIPAPQHRGLTVRAAGHPHRKDFSHVAYGLEYRAA
jgi:hypothetical protein